MRVQMRQLGVIHPAGRTAHRIDVEQLDRLITVDDLGIAMAPAETQQIVAQSFRQEALLAEFQHADSTVALGQLGAVSAVDQRDVGELRQFPAVGLVDLDLAEGVGQVIVAADDVGDAHVVVIDDHGVQVGRRAVAAQDDHIVELGIGDAHVALDEIGHDGLAFLRGAQADHRLDVGRSLGGIAVAPGAVQAERALFGGGGFAHGGELGRAEVAAIGAAGGQHLQRHLGVAGLAGGLMDDGFVGVQTEPIESLDDHLGGGIGAALAVGVFHPQQELAAVVAGEQVVEQRRAGAADVQQASGGRRETGTDSHRGACLGSMVRGYVACRGQTWAGTRA